MRHFLVLLAIIFCLCAQSTLAQVQPDAGSLLIDARQQPVMSPLQQSDDLLLSSPSERLSDLSIATMVQINAVSIRGATVFSEAELLVLLDHEVGTLYDMVGMQGLGEAITSYYQQEGYPFAYAYLPAQSLYDGSLTIEVLEGQYGSITTSGDVEGTGAARFYFEALQIGDVIAQERLSRAVLVLGDVPGVTAKPVLSSGEELGTANLEVAVSQTRGWNGIFSLDNHGNRYAGDTTARLSLGYNHVQMFDDRLSFSLSGKSGDMTVSELGYDFALGSNGLRGGFVISQSSYSLGKGFVGFSGSARTSSVTLSYPLVRSERTNLSVTIGRKHDETNDSLKGVSFEDKTSWVTSSGLSFDHRDTWFGGGQTSGTATLSEGKIISNLSTSVQGRFDGKVVLDIYRQQSLSGPLSLLVHGYKQISSSPLNGSQQVSLGCASCVRAYPPGEAPANSGGYLQTDLLYDLGIYQPFVFYDIGSTHEEATNPVRTLSGYGMGLRAAQDNFQGSVSAAWKDVGGQSQSDTLQRNPQIWAQLAYSF